MVPAMALPTAGPGDPPTLAELRDLLAGVAGDVSALRAELEHWKPILEGFDPTKNLVAGWRTMRRGKRAMTERPCGCQEHEPEGGGSDDG